MEPHVDVVRFNTAIAVFNSLEVRPLNGIFPEGIVSILREAVTISGLVPEEDLCLLGSVVTALAPVRTLEIGLASGSTAITICCAKPNDDNAKHIALDPFQWGMFKDLALERIYRSGCLSKFEIIRQFSYLALPQLILGKELLFDFIYIDAGHQFDQTLIEWFFCDKLLKPGGVIGFDDCHWPMVKTVLNYVEANCAYQIVKPNERTWFAVKKENDSREWFDFSPFTVAWDQEYPAAVAQLKRLEIEAAPSLQDAKSADEPT